jgi:hypothetical protein
VFNVTENEKQDEKQSNAKYISVLARLTPQQKEQVTKICADKKIDVTEFIRKSLDKSISEVDPTVLQGAVKFDFAAADAQVSRISFDCMKLLRSLGKEHREQVEAIAQRLGLKLDLSNLESVSSRLSSYPVPIYEGGFSGFDLDNFVQYLRLCKKRLELKTLIKNERAKSNLTDPEANEFEEDQIEDSEVPESAEEEHNKRCYAIIAEIEKHNHEVCIDPLNMIRMITDYEYGGVYLDDKQKAILHAYLKENNLPYPRYKRKQESQEEQAQD